MPIQCLIRANSSQVSKGILKGMVETIKEEPCTWGNREGLPDYVILRIPDATLAQAQTFMQAWLNIFEYVVQDVPISNSKQITLSIDPKIVEVLGDGKALKIGLRDLIIAQWGAEVVAHNLTSVTFNVSADADFQQMKEQLKDLFEETVAYRIYMFAEVDVDWAINNGGYAELTRSQALTRIIDRRK